MTVVVVFALLAVVQMSYGQSELHMRRRCARFRRILMRIDDPGVGHKQQIDLPKWTAVYSWPKIFVMIEYDKPQRTIVMAVYEDMPSGDCLRRQVKALRRTGEVRRAVKDFLLMYNGWVNADRVTAQEKWRKIRGYALPVVSPDQVSYA